MTDQIYFGSFDGIEDVISYFDVPAGALDDAEVHYASYETPSYEGYATVVFSKDGKVFEVHGSHCSCYGLEGQWHPEETTWEAIAMQPELKELAARFIGGSSASS